MGDQPVAVSRALPAYRATQTHNKRYNVHVSNGLEVTIPMIGQVKIFIRCSAMHTNFVRIVQPVLTV
jgi:hypothetical protein